MAVLERADRAVPAAVVRRGAPRGLDAHADHLVDRAAVDAATTPVPSGSPNARALKPAAILRLQRTAGNREVAALVERTQRRDGHGARRRDGTPSGPVPAGRQVQRDLLDDLGGAAGEAWDTVSGGAGTVADAAVETAGEAVDAASTGAGAVADAAVETAGQAWDAASTGAGAVADAAVETAGEAVDVASGAAGTVADAAVEVAGDAVDVASDVAGTVADTAGEAWDSVTETVSDVADTVTEGVSAAWDEATDLAADVVDGVTDVAGRAWDSLADTARDVASGVSENVSDAWNAVADGAERVWNGVTGAVGGAWDAVSGAANGAWEAVKGTASAVVDGVRDLAADAWEGIKGAAGAAWGAVSGAVGSLWNTVTNGAARALEGLAQNVPVPGSDVRSRGLTDPERSQARAIFGDRIDYDVVVVTRGSLAAAGADRTTGNTISLMAGEFDGETLNLTTRGMETLIHELTHVLQFQQGGLGYIPESLWDQLISKIRTGKVDSAYDWRPLDAAGVPWDQWHVEPQAQAVEDYNRELMRRDRGEAFDAPLIARLQRYVDEMKAGPRP